MSRIKWRAWDCQNKEYFKPTYEAYKNRLEELLLMPCGDLCMRTMDGTAHESTFQNRFIVEQFTGLVDKNGKEIYEGDIVKCREVGYDEEVVAFTYGGFYPFCIMGWELTVDNDACEVIGNIHEKE